MSSNFRRAFTKFIESLQPVTDKPLSKGLFDGLPDAPTRPSNLKGKHRVGGHGKSHEGSHWESSGSLSSAPPLILSPTEDYKMNGVHSKALCSWFGDWQNNPHNASKVVGEDGKPQVVYHGTSRGGFNSFEDDGVDKLFGPGLNFTESAEVANYYASPRYRSTHRRFKSDLAEQWQAEVADDDLWEEPFTATEKRQVSQFLSSLSDIPSEMEGSPTRHGDDLDYAPGARILASAGYSVDELFEDAPREVKSCYLNIRQPCALDEPLTEETARQLFFLTRKGASQEDFESWKEQFNKLSYANLFMDNEDEWVSTDVKESVVKALRDRGNDGLMHWAGAGSPYDNWGPRHRVWIAFEPNQIKAVDNEGTFDDSANIYKSVTAADNVDTPRALLRDTPGDEGEPCTCEEGDKWLGYGRGPNGIAHPIRVCLKCGKLHVLGVDGQPLTLGPTLSKSLFDGKPDTPVRASKLKGKHRIGGQGESHKGSHWETDGVPLAAPSLASPAQPDAAPLILSPAEDYKANGVHSKAFCSWFGDWENDPHNASKVVDEDGKPQQNYHVPAVVYHGTNRHFEEFDPSRARTAINQHYQGDGLFFTPSQEVAEHYSHAARNSCLDRKLVVGEVAEKFPPFLAELFRKQVDEGFDEAWKGFDMDALRAYEAAHPDFIVDDLTDVAQYTEGSKTAQDTSNPLSIFGGPEDLPDWVNDCLERLGLTRSMVTPRVIACYLNARNILKTDDPEKAKAARAQGYDGVFYNGPGTVDGVPEWIVYDPSQVKAVDNAGTFDASGNMYKSMAFDLWGYPLLDSPWLSKKMESGDNHGETQSDTPPVGQYNAKGERWITVHPNGDDEEGHPVLIHKNNDGSHTIVGGAGGKLNGLRLAHVKSPSQYAGLAREKRDARRAKRESEQQEHFRALKAKHRQALSEELLQAGTPIADADFHAEVERRAHEEWANSEGGRQEAIGDLQDKKRLHEKGIIAAAAKAQGWDESALAVPQEALDQIASVARAQAMENPRIKDALNGMDLRAAENAKALVEQQAQQAVAKVVNAHHKAVYDKAREVLKSAKQVILAAHDNHALHDLGDVAIGDLVTDTFGDSGKGYSANLQEEAAKRGLILDAGEEEEVDGGQQEADGSEGEDNAETEPDPLEAAIQKAMKEYRVASPDDLNAQLQPQTVGEAAQFLSQAQSHENARLAVQKDLRVANRQSVFDGSKLETLAPAAVIQGSELSPEDALKQVTRDWEENQRQEATRGLVHLVNEQDELSPVRQHRLQGHNAFFANVGKILGVRAPDPLQADILGEHISAALVRRALEKAVTTVDANGNAQIDESKVTGAREALAAHHVDKQVELCHAATDEAQRLLEEAANLPEIPLDSTVGMMAAVDQHKTKTALLRKAREVAGLALGKMEAAAALNEVLQGSNRSEMQVALGALSHEDAVKRAYAVGLSRPDEVDGEGTVLQHGQFGIVSDGKNQILQIHDSGLDALATDLAESASHTARAAKVSAIKAGQEDERGWLPAGFARRPAIDVSAGDNLVVPEKGSDLDLGGIEDNEQGSVALQEKLKSTIGQRIEAGHDPLAIVSDLGSVAFRRSHVPDALEDAYRSALDAVAPPITGRNPDEKKAQHDELVRTLRSYQPETPSPVHAQPLNGDNKTRDLLYQVALQDPRLQYAFHEVGELGRDGRAALRDYAFQHIFKGADGKALDAKDKEQPLVPLDNEQRAAFNTYRKVWKENLDPWATIQEHWKQQDTGNSESLAGNLFGEAPQAHDFATVDLSDDNAVIEAARKHAGELGYKVEHRGVDAKAFTYGEKAYPELEVSDERSLSSIARDARKRIQGQLMAHLVGEMAGKRNIAGSFNPQRVPVGGQRWGDYVGDIGGETRAYQTIAEKMRGDFASRFARGHQMLFGKEFPTTAIPLTYGDAHALASLTPEARKEYESKRASEQAKVRKREAGKFGAEGEGAVVAKQEAAKQAELLSGALFGSEEGKSEAQKKDTHRLSLGRAAEGMVRSLMPAVHVKKGAVAASNIDMSSPDGVKRQRFIKLLSAAGRLNFAGGTGLGKTAGILGGFSQLKSEGKVRRALLAVPSNNLDNFGIEAARFYDMTKEGAPNWHADGNATPQERRAAYHRDSGHDLVVVTPQALREDLTHALAVHRFNGDTDRAKDFLLNAPEHERNAAMKSACAALGWDFDMFAGDESHVLLDRTGKKDSAMSHAIDAFHHDKPHMALLSADPVKNDVSEAFSLLKKVAPQRYVADDHPALYDENGRRAPGLVTKSEFLRKYSVNTPAATEALQREMEPYQYAESAPPKRRSKDGTLSEVAKITRRHELQPTLAEKADYDRVMNLYNRAKSAQARGLVDVDAIKSLCPKRFENQPPESHEAIAAALGKNLAFSRDAALDRVTLQHPQGARFQKLDELLQKEPPTQQPRLIFAHNLEAVDAIAEHLKAQGHRVAVLKGGMSSEAKEAARDAYSPPWDKNANGGKGGYVREPSADLMVSSDAGSVAMNAQRGARILQWDTPQTAMTYNQRTARSHRTGQNRDVVLDHFTMDVPHEKRRLETLAGKDDLREALTTPADRIDDSGLAHAIFTAQQKALHDAVKAQANQGDDSQTENEPEQSTDAPRALIQDEAAVQGEAGTTNEAPRALVR